jgi:threonine/homoserine/homoserine lactone efflux protein
MIGQEAFSYRSLGVVVNENNPKIYIFFTAVQIGGLTERWKAKGGGR